LHFKTKMTLLFELAPFDKIMFFRYGRGTREYMEKRAFRKGPHLESFEQLSAQYVKMIHSIIHSLHIYKNKEEYFQIGLISLWQASSRFDPSKGSFTNYAYSYIKGKILNELHKNKLIEERNVHVEEEILELMAESYFDHPLQETLLLSYCVDLTENQKKWLMDTVSLNLSVKEIAKKEGVSVSAVKQWRQGARGKLIDRLGKIDQ
jgi:RNA polymerase sigma factor (sigma-70 family)